MSASVATRQPSFDELKDHLVNPRMQARVAGLIRRYPSPQAALLQVLWLAQHEIGWLPHTAVEWAAKQCGTSPVHAWGVATFYTMYHKAPVGKYLLQICRNVSCHALGADGLIAHAEKILGIPSDGAHSTPDGLFTLLQVECLGACGNGPVMQVNDDFVTDIIDNKPIMPKGVGLTKERMEKIIAWCKANPQNGLVRDPLGGELQGDLGHPGAQGAVAKIQESFYAPAPPALGVKGVVRAEGGVSLTWRVAPETTELSIECNSGAGTFQSVAQISSKEKAFVHADGKANYQYRIIASSGSQVAVPSSVCHVEAT